MKKSIFILSLLFLTAIGHAQRTIVGTVTEGNTGQPLPGAHVRYEGENLGTVSDQQGHYQIPWDDTRFGLRFEFPGCDAQVLLPGDSDTLDVVLYFSSSFMGVDTVVTFDPETYEEAVQVVRNDFNAELFFGNIFNYGPTDGDGSFNTEDYSPIRENGDKSPVSAPLSTFSIDVDNASYSNVRRFLLNDERPPVDAVRIEELVNYFDYEYPQPKGKHPFSITTELSDCPWNADRKLLLIGLQGKDADYASLPPSNLVFLLDVSGSMQDDNKLTLVKHALRLLVEQLRPQDRVSIVVYAGAAGLVLPPTPGDQPQAILDAIDGLAAGGSTAGGQGIQLAYDVAAQHFLPNGNNRVILATDGDFNVGMSSDGELLGLIEEKRKTGVFLTVLGFGMGNLKDNKLETLANAGNGNYAYIDQLAEAKKAFVTDLRGSLFTIAKDVKVQVEFNPVLVASYRLVGYENRMLQTEDFANDERDAGELGAGHRVTALYELVLQKNSPPSPPPASGLRYQHSGLTKNAQQAKELANIQFRYKPPQGDKSVQFSQIIENQQIAAENTSNNFRFAAAVAGFGMLLRKSEFNKNMDWQAVQNLAKSAVGKDRLGYRAEFLELVGRCY